MSLWLVVVTQRMMPGRMMRVIAVAVAVCVYCFHECSPECLCYCRSVLTSAGMTVSPVLLSQELRS